MKKNDGGTEGDGEKGLEKGMLEMQVRLAAQEHKLKVELGLKLEHLEEELRSTTVERDELKDALESRTMDLESTKSDLESTKKDLQFEITHNESQSRAHEALCKEKEDIEGKATKWGVLEGKLVGGFKETLHLYKNHKIFNLQNRGFIPVLVSEPTNIVEQLHMRSQKSLLHIIHGVCVFLDVDREADICVEFIDPASKKGRRKEIMAAFQKYRKYNNLKLPIHFAVNGNPEGISSNLANLAVFLRRLIDGSSLANVLKEFPDVILVIGKLDPPMEGEHKLGYLQCLLKPEAVIVGAVESAESDAEDRKRLLGLKLDISVIDRLSSSWDSIFKNFDSKNEIKNQVTTRASLKDSAYESPAAIRDEEITTQSNISVNTQQARSGNPSIQISRRTRSSTRSKGTRNQTEPPVRTNARGCAKHTNRNQASTPVPGKTRSTRSSTRTKDVGTPVEQGGAMGLRKKRSTSRQPRVVPKASLSPNQDLSALSPSQDLAAHLMSRFEISEHTPTTPARRSIDSMESRWTSSPESSQSEYGTAASSSSEESPLGHRRGNKYDLSRE